MISHSLIVQHYNGHLIRIYAPKDVKGLSKAERVGLSVAAYQRPMTREGREWPSMKPVISETPECLSASSCLYPIHDAPNFARWIQEKDAAALAKLDGEIARLQENRKRLVTAAFKRGRPVTPDEIRGFGDK